MIFKHQLSLAKQICCSFSRRRRRRPRGIKDKASL